MELWQFKKQLIFDRVSDRVALNQFGIQVREDLHLRLNQTVPLLASPFLWCEVCFGLLLFRWLHSCRNRYQLAIWTEGKLGLLWLWLLGHLDDKFNQLRSHLADFQRALNIVRLLRVRINDGILACLSCSCNLELESLFFPLAGCLLENLGSLLSLLFTNSVFFFFTLLCFDFASHLCLVLRNNLSFFPLLSL